MFLKNTRQVIDARSVGSLQAVSEAKEAQKSADLVGGGGVELQIIHRPGLRDVVCWAHWQHCCALVLFKRHDSGALSPAPYPCALWKWFLWRWEDRRETYGVAT
ncbi:hypothetical protein KM043_004494 [Ampulex compressa]|nr:hypothetical protein KM043_004494 [Ampulex compressa]